MDISSTQRSTSASTSSKKRKAHEMGELITDETFIKAATLLGDKIEIIGKELNKSAGLKMAIHKKVEDLFDALNEIEELTEDELDIALSLMLNHPTQIIVFFSLPPVQRHGCFISFFYVNNLTFQNPNLPIPRCFYTPLSLTSSLHYGIEKLVMFYIFL